MPPYSGCCTVLMNGCQSSPGKPEIYVENIWSRPVAVRPAVEIDDDAKKNNQRMDYTGVVYLSIRNKGGEADHLIRAATAVCRTVEIHETKIEDGRMTMQMVKNGLEIPANGTVDFSPGGHHIMLIGMKQSLNVGEKFSLSLEFEKSGLKSLESEIREY